MNGPEPNATEITLRKIRAEWEAPLLARISSLEGLVRSVQAGISDGPDSGSFNVVLHGNWFIVAASLLNSAEKQS